jgi:hypothetical protein
MVKLFRMIFKMSEEDLMNISTPRFSLLLNTKSAYLQTTSTGALKIESSHWSNLFISVIWLGQEAIL